MLVDAFVVRQLAADHDARVDARTVHARDVQHQLTVVEQQHIAGTHVLRQTLVGDADGGLVAGAGVERNVECEGVAFVQDDLALREALDADLRALQVAEHRDPFADLLRNRAHHLDALGVRLRVAVREVDAHDVRAGAQHVRQHFGIVGGRAECREDLGASEHRQFFARSSSTATAGNFLPSRNSRNAPPPVEM